MVREAEPGFGTVGIKTSPETVYEAVLPVLLRQLDRPCAAADLAKALDVQKKQLDMWLQEAVRRGVVRKLSRPLRFVAVLAGGEGSDLAHDADS